MLSSQAKRELKTNQRRILIDSLEIGIVSPQQISSWGERQLPNGKKVGEVKNCKTVSYKRFMPLRDGLFCERIFGPVNSYLCACGKEQIRADTTFCNKCEVEYTDRRVRRHRLGYIPLLSPVAHIWYLKGRPSYLSLFLGKRKKKIVELTYCNAYLVEQAYTDLSQTELALAPANVSSSTQKREAHGDSRYTQRINSSSKIRHIFKHSERTRKVELKAISPISQAGSSLGQNSLGGLQVQSVLFSKPTEGAQQLGGKIEDQSKPIIQQEHAKNGQAVNNQHTLPTLDLFQERMSQNTSPLSFLHLLTEVLGHIRKDVILTDLSSQDKKDKKDWLSAQPLWGYTYPDKESIRVSDKAYSPSTAASSATKLQERRERANTRFSTSWPYESRADVNWRGRVTDPYYKTNRTGVGDQEIFEKDQSTSPLPAWERLTPEIFRAGDVRSIDREIEVEPRAVTAGSHLAPQTNQLKWQVGGETVQRAFNLYNRAHTLPFLPSLLCRYNVRDELLNYLNSSPFTRDKQILPYCALKRWQPLQDAHQFLSEQVISQLDQNKSSTSSGPDTQLDTAAERANDKRLPRWRAEREQESERGNSLRDSKPNGVETRKRGERSTTLRKLASLRHILYLALLQKSFSLRAEDLPERISKMSSILTVISRERVIHDSIRLSRRAEEDSTRTSQEGQRSITFNSDLEKSLSLSRRFQAVPSRTGRKSSFYRVSAIDMEQRARRLSDLLPREAGISRVKDAEEGVAMLEGVLGRGAPPNTSILAFPRIESQHPRSHVRYQNAFWRASNHFELRGSSRDWGLPAPPQKRVTDNKTFAKGDNLLQRKKLRVLERFEKRSVYKRLISTSPQFDQVEDISNLIGLASTFEFTSRERSYRLLLLDKRWVRSFLLEKKIWNDKRRFSKTMQTLQSLQFTPKDVVQTQTQTGTEKPVQLLPSLAHPLRSFTQRGAQPKMYTLRASNLYPSNGKTIMGLRESSFGQSQLLKRTDSISMYNPTLQKRTLLNTNGQRNVLSHERGLINKLDNSNLIFVNDQDRQSQAPLDESTQFNAYKAHLNTSLDPGSGLEMGLRALQDCLVTTLQKNPAQLEKAARHLLEPVDCSTATAKPGQVERSSTLSFFLILPRSHRIKERLAHQSSTERSIQQVENTDMTQPFSSSTTLQISLRDQSSYLLDINQAALSNPDASTVDSASTHPEMKDLVESKVEDQSGASAGEDNTLTAQSELLPTPELITIREILSYTGGGGLHKLLQRFHTQLLSIFLLQDIQAVRALYRRVLPPNLSSREILEMDRPRKRALTRISRRLYKNSRRFKIVQLLTRCKRRPEWMMISILPVLPPDLRPITQMGESGFVASDLNNLYQRVIYRNNRLHKLDVIDFHIVTGIQRLVQDAVDRLIENGKGGTKPFSTLSGRPLKSLSDTLKGKKGRFRMNLLGKRVDFSARSVIVVSPQLKVHECGLPREIALQLYQYFLLRELLLKKEASNILVAKKRIKERDPVVWDALQNIIYHHPVLLNRAPTLHRLGIQAFQPQLVQGSAILLNPLVCSGFNADFDGDQMGVHLPLSAQARAEAWDLLWARNNLLSPATGDPVFVPTQDMVLGFYYMTQSFCSRSYLSSSLKRKDLFNQLKNQSHLKKNGSTLALLAPKEIDQIDVPKDFRLPVSRKLARAKRVFVSSIELIRAFQQKHIQIHTPVYLQWQGKIENDERSQTPLELRLNGFASSTYIYSQYKHRKDENTSQCNSYIRTTAGRVLVNQIIFD